MIKYILFDMDGLMVDSEIAVFNIWQQLYAEHGIDFQLDTYRKMLARTVSVKGAISSSWPAPEIRDTLKTTWTRLYMQMALEGKVAAKPGLYELLDYCEANGIRKAVASSSGMERVIPTLYGDKIYYRLDAFVTGEDVHHGKPNPEPFLLAAERLGKAIGEEIKLDECLVLEDTQRGIEAGVAAGAKVIWIPDLVAVDDEHAKMVEFVGKTLADVIPWLEKNKA